MRAWLRVGWGGALGGGLNAAHYLWWRSLTPATVDDGALTQVHFEWHLVPAGALHGGLLAAVAFAGGMLLARSHFVVKVLGALLVGWIAGAVSWIPFEYSIFGRPWVHGLTWMFSEVWLFALLYYFGLVASFYCFFISLPASRWPALRTQILFASVSGILGSLQFWGARWGFSFLHGAVWGTCVGASAWFALRARRQLE